MKRILSFVLALCAVLSLCTLTSCKGGKEKFTRSSYTLFDTHSVIIGYEKSEEDFQKNSDLILDNLEFYHRLYDIYYEYDGINNLKTVNDNAGGEPVRVDRAIIDLLLFAKEMYTLTDGKTNVAMGSVLSLWHEYREAGLDDPESAALPAKDELEERALHTDIKNVIIDTEGSTVFLADKEMSLDVGAVAKGYAVEMTALYMEKAGISGYALSVGGNVRCIGERGDGKKWEVGVQDPDLTSDTAYFAKVSLSDTSLVTSGTYQRFYTVDGKEYHHIIDPETLFPGNRFASVSVLCKDSGMADALSTALFNMSEEEGQDLLSSLEGVEAAWVYPDGTYSMTKGFKEMTIK